MSPLIDPRRGDVEDDASSTKQRSLLALAGSLLAEISLPKLAMAWLLLIVLPATLLGLAPLVATAWFASLSRTIASPMSGVWTLALLVLIAAVGWIGGRPLFRLAEKGFWSLNSLAVQPGYAACREALRHLSELAFGARLDADGRARLRAFSAAGAGLIAAAIALVFVWLAWPLTRWSGDIADLNAPLRLVVPTLANAVVLIGAYLAAASFLWGSTDAIMAQPRDLAAFDPPAGEGPAGHSWRIAHLSDLHTVGERFGYRIESGRSGAQGNGRLSRVFAQLEAIHARTPLDLVLVTGDVTDAGRSAEWAEFFTALQKHPELQRRTLLLPGNHDVNVVDRANPARLDLPTSPGKRLRQMRSLSAFDAVQGDRVHTVDPASLRLGCTLSEWLDPHRSSIATFADSGTLRLSFGLEKLWAGVFPMVLPPQSEDGLGVLLLNSNAETHFSFTNALGLVSAEQMLACAAVTKQFPRAFWIVALHHHLVEYPAPAKTFAERIGTALINGTWFVRQLQSYGERVVVMHGHRHIDWVGECGGLRIISAPSPVMEATNDRQTCFYIHTVSAAAPGRLALLAPQRVDVAGEAGPA